MTLFCRSAAVVTILVFSALASPAQSAPAISPMTPDIPPKFTAPRTDYDYIKRVEYGSHARRRQALHRHRDSQGREARADPADPHAL